MMSQSIAFDAGTLCSWQAVHDQLIGVLDHLSQLGVFNRTVQVNGVPVALVRVVPGTDSREASSQLEGKLWVALEVHETWAPLERDRGEHPASDLEHGNAVAERVSSTAPGKVAQRSSTSPRVIERDLRRR
jgi:hypothetical protein